MPIFNGKTEELMKAVPAPYNIRLARRRFLKLISQGLDIRVRFSNPSNRNLPFGPQITFRSTARNSNQSLATASSQRQPSKTEVLRLASFSSVPRVLTR